MQNQVYFLILSLQSLHIMPIFDFSRLPSHIMHFLCSRLTEAFRASFALPEMFVIAMRQVYQANFFSIFYGNFSFL